MKNPEYTEALREVISAVMEQTAFMFPEPAGLEDGFTFDEFEVVLVTLRFSGDREGEMSLVVPVELCHELSANILGEEKADEINRDKCADAAKEMLNIITGQMLTRLFGDGALFNLSAPVCKEPAQEEFFAALEDRDYACFRIDTYPVIATFMIMSGHYVNKGTGS
ncbi:MAG: chemotaxis protein CheX [Candidatus Zixiibacteriota bacterium]